MLAVPLPLLSQRVLLREISEPILKEQIENNYPKNKIFELIHRINYIEFHNSWINLFHDNNIKLQFVLVNNNNYTITNDLHQFEATLKNDTPVNYSDAQIKSILDKHKFEYQQIKVLDQCKTTGSDRSKTFKKIKSNIELAGKSVLDIGCAYGFFCFESEKSKAKKVVGTELKSHRFIGSNIIKQFTGSKCEFKYTDIFKKETSDKFDITLLLNVIHHLPEPISALKKAASLTNEVLVLEFPTLDDKKFLSTITPGIKIDTSLPLIGVSLAEDQDQTFVYNKEAIKRILIDNNKLFQSIEFFDSPISKTRLLAFCYK